METKIKKFKAFSQDDMAAVAGIFQSAFEIDDSAVFSTLFELTKEQYAEAESRAKQKTKKYKVYDVADIEKAVSTFVGKDTKIDEIEMIISYYPNVKEIDYACYVDGTYLDDENAADGEDAGPLKDFKYDFREPQYIFNFDTALFKRFEIEVLSDD